MRIFIVTLFLGLLTNTSLFAGNLVTENVSILQNNPENFKLVTLFESEVISVEEIEDIHQNLAAGTLLKLDKAALSSFIANPPETMRFRIPGGNNIDQEVLLYKVNIFGNDFMLTPSNGIADPSQDLGVHYHGIIDGDQNSLVAMSFFDKEISGLIANEIGNFTIGEMGGKHTQYHVFYQDNQLIGHNKNVGCGMDDIKLEQPIALPPTLQTNKSNQIPVPKCVQIYVEADYPLYVSKGSGVSSYMSGMFNQWAVIFAAESITIQMSQLYINYSYTGYLPVATGNSNVDRVTILNNFQNWRFNSFNGDLAILCYDFWLGGVAATINGFCVPNRKYSMTVSQVEHFYYNVPTYSISIGIPVHELGHLFGSPHTHGCYWNGNNTAIDGCGQSQGYYEGSCSQGPIPGGGGTIMSYCHLLTTGINFNYAFGTQPGNLIYQVTQSAGCVGQCLGSCPYTLNLNGNHNSTSNVTYRASNSIYSTDNVGNGANVNCRAAAKITLEPGFEAVPGSYFRANIDGCNNP